MAKKKQPGPLEMALREFRWSFVFTALAFVVLGLVLIIWPDASMNVLCYLVGAALTVYGGLNICGFLFSRDRSVTFELIIGVITTAIGIFILISPSTIQDMLSIILGLVVVIDSLVGIKRSFSLRELGLGAWWLILILSVVAAFLGVLFIVHKEIFGRGLLIVVGAVLLYQGISDLLSVIQISIRGRRVKKRLNDIVNDNIIDADN